jgi:hypothetical protein
VAFYVKLIPKPKQAMELPVEGNPQHIVGLLFLRAHDVFLVTKTGSPTTHSWFTKTGSPTTHAGFGMSFT